MAVSSCRNDNLPHMLHQKFEEAKLEFVTPTFEFPAGDEVSLQVCLSEDEQRLIDQCLPGPGESRPADKKLAEEVERLELMVNAFVDWFVA